MNDGKPWKHRTLGEFAPNGPGWAATVNVPAFKAFSYDTGFGPRRRSTGKCALAFYWLVGDLPAKPPPEMLALADRILNDPQAIVAKVVAALWDDFNGRGPDSGMWWHGNMSAVASKFRGQKLPPLRHSSELLSGMRLHTVTVWNQWYEHPAPVVVLMFFAAFEPEHGVGVLTDGEQILGTGYADEVTPWKSKRMKSTRKQSTRSKGDAKV